MENTLNVAVPRKRLFIGLMFGAALCLELCLWLCWRITAPGLREIWLMLPFVAAALLLAVGLLVPAVLLNLTAAVAGWGAIKRLNRLGFRIINLLFPVALQMGKLAHITRRELEGSFIAVSNALFAGRNIKIKGEELLVMTPHCLQLAACPHKITRDVQNCHRCGGCNIGDLVTLAERWGFRLFVATGGTLARQIIMEQRPRVVLAIACERDLMSGIRDVYPLPAIGVLNIRPHGPCYNTRVDMREVERVLEQIVITPKESAKIG